MPARREPLQGLRVGLPREFFPATLAGDVDGAVRAAVAELVKLGASAVDVSLPRTELSIPVYYIIAPAEASSNLSRYDGVRYGHRAAHYDDLLDLYRRTRAEGFGAEVKRRIMIGTYVLSHGYYDAYYLQAQKLRRMIADDFQRCFQSCDLIAGPVAPSVAWKIGEQGDDPVKAYLADIFTLPASLAGLPGMSVPAGQRRARHAGGPAADRQLLRRGALAASRPRAAAGHRLAPCGARWGLTMVKPPLVRGYEVVIGLETHAQLHTRSKAFSGSSTAFGAAPNTQASAVDLALPGTLPVLNRSAVECAIRFGLAVGARIAQQSIFARKNYFYPDLPKGYQISQYETPVVQGGRVPFMLGEQRRSVTLTRAHLEEDAGKSLHEGVGGHGAHDVSGIDLNRAGTPLLEIVTEPDMRSAAEAVEYARALHTLVVWLGICDGNMQEGSFRCDANVSVRKPGGPLGTRREIKNLNSFRFMQQAIEFEVDWQIDRLEDGLAIEQATVLFDPDSGETRAMRSKEDAHDYRYFPDPDLPPLVIAPQWIEQVKAAMPELPGVMAERFVRDDGLPAYDAAMMTQSLAFARYYEAARDAVQAAQAGGELADGRGLASA